MPIIIDSPQDADDDEYLTLDQAIKNGWFPWIVDDSEDD